MRYHRKWSAVFFLLFTFLLPFSQVISGNPPAKEDDSSQVRVKPVAVEVARVITKDMPVSLKTLGGLSAVKVVTVSSVVDGRISKIDFKDGDAVQKGNTIVQLDNTQAKADYESSTTAFNLASIKYKRFSQLLYTAVSRQELDQIKASLATQKAEVKSKLAALNQKKIDAPFSGVLGAFKVHEGDYIKAGDVLVTLVNTSKLQVNYTLPENLLPKLKLNQVVAVVVSAYPHQIFYGRVSFISPTVDSSTRMVAVQALIPNPKGVLSPGMFVRVSHQIGIREGAMVVPEEAVTADVKGYFVYKVIENKAAKTYVTIGSRTVGMVQVLKGLQVNDVVVTAGLQKVEDGRILSVVHSSVASQSAGS